jgi:hypothetical protein
VRLIVNSQTLQKHGELRLDWQSVVTMQRNGVSHPFLLSFCHNTDLIILGLSKMHNLFRRARLLMMEQWLIKGDLEPTDEDERYEIVAILDVRRWHPNKDKRLIQFSMAERIKYTDFSDRVWDTFCSQSAYLHRNVRKLNYEQLAEYQVIVNWIITQYIQQFAPNGNDLEVSREIDVIRHQNMYNMLLGHKELVNDFERLAGKQSQKSITAGLSGEPSKENQEA